ncbi:unnamed protein product [Anisakis simplex]|uniref:G_PROTEIN_RECEP_F1_2 domain-containing protein n=1 Tax=Anisakis simplex TaxID=6269 RepID=A0A0M3J9H0_ANISI|nr:unnamed protein product [Anisakis simplex]
MVTCHPFAAMLVRRASVRYFHGAIIVLTWILVSCLGEDVLVSSRDPMTSSDERRYLLYDVNHGEGFNLRRDVFMRYLTEFSLILCIFHHRMWILS